MKEPHRGLAARLYLPGVLVHRILCACISLQPHAALLLFCILRFFITALRSRETTTGTPRKRCKFCIFLGQRLSPCATKPRREIPIAIRNRVQILHPVQQATLSLRYEAEKQPHGGPRQDANFASCSASDSLAAEFGVSERTIHRDAEFARQVQAASEKFGEQAKIDILKGAVAKDFTCAAIVQSGTCPQLGDYSGRFRLTMELCAPSSMPESPASPRPAPTAIPFRANCRSVARMQCARAGR